MASLVQQTFQLLDRVQATLNRQKDKAMHLSAVMHDVEGTKAIVQRIKSNPQLQGEHLKVILEELLKIATKLDALVTNQEAKIQKDGGFRLFAHDFIKGPTEQQQLEGMRNDLLASKNSLTLGIVVELAPSGTSLVVNDLTMSGMSYAQNGRVIREDGDKDFDHVTVQGVEMSGAAFLMNSSMTEAQQNKFAENFHHRFRFDQLISMMKDSSVDAKLKSDILQVIAKMEEN